MKVFNGFFQVRKMGFEFEQPVDPGISNFVDLFGGARLIRFPIGKNQPFFFQITQQPIHAPHLTGTLNQTAEII